MDIAVDNDFVTGDGFQVRCNFPAISAPVDDAGHNKDDRAQHGQKNCQYYEKPFQLSIVLTLLWRNTGYAQILWRIMRQNNDRPP